MVVADAVHNCSAAAVLPAGSGTYPPRCLRGYDSQLTEQPPRAFRGATGRLNPLVQQPVGSDHDDLNSVTGTRISFVTSSTIASSPEPVAWTVRTRPC
jgi:hypothetical protein